MHLEKIYDELKNNEHGINPEDRIHFASDLVKAATKVSQAVAKEIDPSPYVLQVLEIACLFAKDIPEEDDNEEPAEQEATEEPKQHPWAVIDHQKADIAQPFFPIRKLNEEFDITIIESFETLEEANEYSLQLESNHAIVNIDYYNNVVRYLKLAEDKE